MYLFVFIYINIMSCRSNSKEDYADYGREGAQDFSHQESSTGLYNSSNTTKYYSIIFVIF